VNVGCRAVVGPQRRNCGHKGMDCPPLLIHVPRTHAAHSAVCCDNYTIPANISGMHLVRQRPACAWSGSTQHALGQAPGTLHTCAPSTSHSARRTQHIARSTQHVARMCSPCGTRWWMAALGCGRSRSCTALPGPRAAPGSPARPGAPAGGACDCRPGPSKQHGGGARGGNRRVCACVCARVCDFVCVCVCAHAAVGMVHMHGAAASRLEQ